MEEPEKTLSERVIELERENHKLKKEIIDLTYEHHKNKLQWEEKQRNQDEE